MNEANLKVLVNIIGAVESGGQVYGKRDYARYTPPGKNTENEKTITLGAFQCYGHEARKLIQEIYNTDTEAFWRIDDAGIEAMLRVDWVAARWNPTDGQKKVLIALISSPVGKEVQDRMFMEKLPPLIADCERDYTSDVKAQMMYCEIRHLGGKSPVDRIFGRTGGKFDLDSIMASLVKDQQSSNKNLVGAQKFWSRHLKCREFIDRYAVEENMAVIIGSARGDEYGGATGGKAGDQKQSAVPDYKGEVSRQEWYLHSKGWYCFRAKDPAAREQIALNTEETCDNPHVGYDQGQNRTLLAEAKKVGLIAKNVVVNCETDCGQLQYLGIQRAGINIDDFYTANMKAAVERTKQFYVFTDDAHCKSSARLLRGDMLCTRSKGHVVCVLSDGSKAAEERAKYDAKETSAPVVKPEMDYSQTAGGVTATKSFQKFLNANYAQIIKTACGALITVDGLYGKKTRAAALAVWKFMANKYYGATLTIGNENFFDSCKATAAKMTDAEVDKHPTLGYLIQGILAGRGFYSANLDGVCGTKTKASIKLFQKSKKLTESGSMTADTWHALFN